MSEKKLTIEPGCITCGVCEFIAPEVFAVTDISTIKENANLEKNHDVIQEAVRSCPVSVIIYESIKKDSNDSK